MLAYECTYKYAFSYIHVCILIYSWYTHSINKDIQQMNKDIKQMEEKIR